MRFVIAAEDFARPVSKLMGAQRPSGLYDLALAMDPHELDRVEPRTLHRQHAGNDAHPTPTLLDSAVVDGAIHSLTSRLTCQLALSQIRSSAFLPSASNLSRLQWRNLVVMEETGLPSTNLKSTRWSIPPPGSVERTSIPYAAPELSDRGRPSPGSARRGASACRLPRRRAARAGRSGSTTSRPRSQEPTADGSRQAVSAGPEPLFSSILRVGRGDPPFGPLPTHSQASERRPDGFAAHPPFGQSLLEAHQGCVL